MVLPVPGGGDEGGGDHADLDIDPLEAEQGRAIYCDAADSGPVRGGSKTDGGTGTKEMVKADRDQLEWGQGKGRSKGIRSGGGGGSGVDRLGLGAQGRHTGGDPRWHRVGGLPGSKQLHWSGVDQSGAGWRINSSGGDLKQEKRSIFKI